MAKFLVRVREEHFQDVVVDADSSEDAVLRVLDGEGDYAEKTECIETCDPDTWTVVIEYNPVVFAQNLSNT